ncbi:hypothetical protein AMECASPLE_006384 [Ameca splendens]|uniref:Uncharacterized protein n=1 Tax=Ameca splendens TaxID=208324 RepID=A0ABV0XNG3_9TELE
MPQGGADFHPPPSLSGEISDDPPGSPADKSRTCFMCLSTQTEPKFPLLFWNRMFTITTICIREESCFNTFSLHELSLCFLFNITMVTTQLLLFLCEPQATAGLADI